MNKFTAFTTVGLMAIALTACHSSSTTTTVNDNTSITQASNQAPLNNSITLDLGSPSKATLYQGNKVIQKMNYDKPGVYTIDTSKLANGSYKLVVQTSGTTAQFVLHQSLEFSKPGNINAKISLR